MLFIIQNKQHKATEQLRAETLLKAYFIIKNYTLGAADLIMDSYLRQQHKKSLKDLCIALLLNMTFYVDQDNNLILLFKDKKCDTIAQLITFGNGAIQGSRILQLAFR